MRDNFEEFQQAGADVAVVTMATPDQMAKFSRRWQLPFPCLSDPDQTAYRAFQLPRGGIGAIAGLRVWRRGWQALLRHGVGRVIGDPYQLPGAFLIDRHGMIRFAHRATHSADWPTNATLLSALATI